MYLHSEIHTAFSSQTLYAAPQLQKTVSPTSSEWWKQGHKGLVIWTQCGITLICHVIFRAHWGMAWGWQVHFAVLLLPLHQMMLKQVKLVYVIRSQDSGYPWVEEIMSGGRQERDFYGAGDILFLRSVSLWSFTKLRNYYLYIYT